MKNRLVGGMECGGTKFICAVMDDTERIVDQVRFHTTSPEETLRQAITFFRQFVKNDSLEAVGIGSFGPIDNDPTSETFGRILATPKPGWSGVDVVGPLQRALGVRIAFDTDVNAAALGEFRWGASQGLDPSLYLTIGTGIGGGFIKDGKPLAGLVTPEMGHIRIPHDRERDPFPGACRFHGDCLEGLASGAAIQNRFHSDPTLVTDADPFWDLEAFYIALAVSNYVLTLSPKKIILGGGIMKREFLFTKIWEGVRDILNGYVSSRSLLAGIEEYIVPPKLEGRSGVLGAMALVRQNA